VTRRYKRYKNIPFKEPQPQHIYQRIRRAEDPLNAAKELGVLDEEKLIKFVKEVVKAVNKGLFISFFLVIPTYIYAALIF
jgi:hypothetical protein